MRIQCLVLMTLCVNGLIGLGGCAVDDAATDDQASTGEVMPTPDVVQVPKELSIEQLQGGIAPALTGCGTLVFCADPRFSPHFPSFCTKARAGCNNDKAFADAISLCKSVCSPTSICNGAYYVLGRC